MNCLKYLLILSLCLWTQTATAQSFEKTLWNFNDRIQDNEFNRLSVLINNKSPHDIDKELLLSCSTSGPNRSFVPVRQKVFIPSGASRWVHFVVFVIKLEGTWSLSWDKSKEPEFLLTSIGAPAQVVLTPKGVATNLPKKFLGYDESIFPTSVEAICGLDSVFLDHQPEWSSLQQQAFMRWLTLGGIVHLLTRPDRQPFTFTGELAALNIKGDSLRLGAGEVVRHKQLMVQTTMDTLIKRKYPKPIFAEDLVLCQNPAMSGMGPKLSELISRPNYSWFIIYGCITLYVLLAGPLHFWLSRKTRNPHLIFWSLTLVILVFSSVLAYVTARDRNNRDSVMSIAYAQHSQDGYLVEQWSNAFASIQGQRRFEFETPGPLVVAPYQKHSGHWQTTPPELQLLYPANASKSWQRRYFVEDNEPFLGKITQSQVEEPAVENPTQVKTVLLPGAKVYGPHIIKIERGPGLRGDIFDATLIVEKDPYQLVKATEKGLTFRHLRSATFHRSFAESAVRDLLRHDWLYVDGLEYQLMGGSAYPNFNAAFKQSAESFKPISLQKAKACYITLDYCIKARSFKYHTGIRKRQTPLRLKDRHLFVMVQESKPHQLKNWSGRQNGFIIHHFRIPRDKIKTIEEKGQ